MSSRTTASGLNLRDLMPAGRDGARVRSLVNEIQMLLHEHPVNAARLARRQPVINSVWLWGIGSLEKVFPARLPPLYTDDAWLAGLWRLHGAAARSLDEFAAGGEAGKDTLVACARCAGRRLGNRAGVGGSDVLRAGQGPPAAGSVHDDFNVAR